MQSNQKCECGLEAQIACRCLYEIKYFCLNHFGSHTNSDIDSHIPLSLAQATKWAAPSLRHRNYKLYKVELKLLEYSKKLENHIVTLNSTLENAQAKLNAIFQSEVDKYTLKLGQVQKARTMVQNYKSRSSQEVVQLLMRFKSENLRAVLPDYESEFPVSMEYALKMLAKELGVFIYDELKAKSKVIEDLERIIKMESKIKSEAELRIQELIANLENLVGWKEETIKRLNLLEAENSVRENSILNLSQKVAKEKKLRQEAQDLTKVLSAENESINKKIFDNMNIIKELKSSLLMLYEVNHELESIICKQTEHPINAHEKLIEICSDISNYSKSKDLRSSRMDEFNDELLYKSKNILDIISNKPLRI
jgi:hypothetical protein